MVRRFTLNSVAGIDAGFFGAAGHIIVTMIITAAFNYVLKQSEFFAKAMDTIERALTQMQ